MAFAVIELTELDGYLERGGTLKAFHVHNGNVCVHLHDSEGYASYGKTSSTLLDALILLEYQFKEAAQKEEADALPT